MEIQIIAVSVEDKGKYQLCEVTYKSDGQTKAKKLMSFGAGQGAYNTLKNAPAGSVWQVQSQKNDKGFWDWISVSQGASAPATNGGNTVATPTSSSPRSTYETPEERANRQVLIVRQSSVSNSIEYFKLNPKRVPTVEEVLRTAEQIENYVFGRASDPCGVDLADDII